jgi:hypothetical protein
MYAAKQIVQTIADENKRLIIEPERWDKKQAQHQASAQRLIE